MACVAVRKPVAGASGGSGRGDGYGEPGRAQQSSVDGVFAADLADTSSGSGTDKRVAITGWSSATTATVGQLVPVAVADSRRKRQNRLG